MAALTRRPRPIAASLIACTVFAAAGVHAAPLSEESCSILASEKGEQPTLRDVPGLRILDRRPDNPLVISADDGITINAIVCWRSEARFADNDYLVSEAGFPLYVKADFEDEAKNRTVLLERVSGAFRIRMLSGPTWSEAEKEEMGRFISLFGTKFRERSEQPSQAVQTGTPEPATLAPNAPPDRPHAISERRLAAYDEAIAPYVAEARRTWPDARRRFLSGLPAGHVFFVTTRLRDSEGLWEQSFVRVQSIRDRTITGLIASNLGLVKGYRINQSYSFDENELLDWMVANPDGSEEGNVVGKFLDTYKP
jgi:hypothetical protein